MFKDSSSYLFKIYSPINPFLFSILALVANKQGFLSTNKSFIGYSLGMGLLGIYSTYHEWQRTVRNEIMGLKKILAISTPLCLTCYNLAIYVSAWKTLEYISP